MTDEDRERDARLAVWDAQRMQAIHRLALARSHQEIAEARALIDLIDARILRDRLTPESAARMR